MEKENFDKIIDKIIWGSTPEIQVKLRDNLWNKMVKSSKKTKKIGVISVDYHDFIEWQIAFVNMFSANLVYNRTHRKFHYDDSEYILLSEPHHACGFMFDELIETNNAKNNKNYDAIIKAAFLSPKKSK